MLLSSKAGLSAAAFSTHPDQQNALWELTLQADEVMVQRGWTKLPAPVMQQKV